MTPRHLARERAGRLRAAFLLGVGLTLGCAHAQPLPHGKALTQKERLEAIRRASVWAPTDIPKVNFKAGPGASEGFTQDQWVNCEYVEKDQNGSSPKFTCETSPGHEVKVKYGPRNAEVFGEVLGTRLFWALGFFADRMYPVRVRCHGCPVDPEHKPKANEGGMVVFDPSAVERKLPGRAMETKSDSGWKWSELDQIGPGAPKNAAVQRDALKLLAAFVQHTDSKAANQRLLCPAGQEIGKTGCKSPVLMVQDLGLIFGRAELLIHNKDSVSLATWAALPVWKDESSGECVARLTGSFTGSLSNPKISEAGRAFLAGLMMQLSDAQLRDLFESARVKRRASDPSDDAASGELASVDEWVAAFKMKRAQIADRQCAS